MKKRSEAGLEDAIINHLCESGGFVFVPPACQLGGHGTPLLGKMA